jgi:hypothetical protein
MTCASGSGWRPFPAWTLAAFAIGALAGMLIRRVVPAIVATLAVYAGLAVATGGFLREHYLTPLVTTIPNVPGTAWIISHWWTKDGRFAFVGNPSLNLLNEFCSSLPPGQGKPSVGTFAQCLAQHGYTQWTSYQPPAGSGPSSGSRAAGCSRCQRCSSPQPSGWSNAAPPDPSRQALSFEGGDLEGRAARPAAIGRSQGPEGLGGG